MKYERESVLAEAERVEHAGFPTAATMLRKLLHDWETSSAALTLIRQRFAELAHDRHELMLRLAEFARERDDLILQMATPLTRQQATEGDRGP